MLTENYENMKQVLNIKVRQVDEAYDFETEQIIPGSGKVIQLHYNESMKVARQKVRHEFGLPDDSRFFLIHYEPLPNGTIQMASMIPDVNTWEEGFFTVKNLYIYHDTDYLLVPVDHPKFLHFASKISLANTKSRIKLRAMGEQHELWVPRYANNKELVDLLRNFVDWDLKAWDVFIIDFGEKKSLNTIPPLQRSVGIPDDLEIMLERTEDVLEKSKRKLIPASDYVGAGEEVRESIFISQDEGDEEAVKFMVDPTITVESLLILLKDHYGIDQSSARRLRDLYTKKLYTKDDMKLTIAQLRKIESDGTCDQGERLRFERGPMPKAGGLVCTIKVDIYDEKGEKIKLKDEFLFTINDTVGDLFDSACSKMNVDPKDYTLYTCNWNDEPVRKLKDSTSTAEQEGLTEDCTLKLLHYSQGMSDEIRTYEVFYSATGFPLDLKQIGKISINENRKLEEMKEEIKALCTKEKGFETPFTVQNMLLRQLNKIQRPGTVLCEDNKTIKRLKINCIGLVFTIFDHPVTCKPTDLHVFIRERIAKNYAAYHDLVIEETKQGVSSQALKDAILKHKGVEHPETKDIILIKYIPKEHVWLRMAEESENICRKPYFVTAGDVVGYIIVEKGTDVTGDDFQTDEDKQMRSALLVCEDGPRRRFSKETSFKCNVDF